MATLADRLGDAEYKNWIKDVLCLGFVKDGIETFADERSQLLHQHVIQQLGSNPSAQQLCKKAHISKQANKWKMNCAQNCPGNCQQYIDELEKMCDQSFKFEKDNWNNSNNQLWPKEPWEMVKVYMNKGQRGAHKTPKDTDLSGILNFIDHCILARNGITYPYNISSVSTICRSK